MKRFRDCFYFVFKGTIGILLAVWMSVYMLPVPALAAGNVNIESENSTAENVDTESEDSTAENVDTESEDSTAENVDTEREEAAENIDTEKAVSLTLCFQDGETAVVGASFEIYFIATVDEYGEVTFTKDFKQFQDNFGGGNEADWRSMAFMMEEYVLQNDISPAAGGKTDVRGELSFPGGERKLEQGWYLVSGSLHTQGGKEYTTQPFPVQLPLLEEEDGGWLYEVTAYIKYMVRPETPEEPETPEGPEEPGKPETSEVPEIPEGTEDSVLPQTGQYWWPMFILFAAGLVFIIIGFIRCLGVAEEESDENSHKN
ncbi:MAG: hypothetical protein IJZ84_05900 [Lachnospiraceae bacterium]|nr:hypothetical protein [Lachnospiraceae bacterium]